MKIFGNTKEFIEKNKYYFIYFLICIVSLIYMIHRSDNGSLWYDEMHTFGYAMGHEAPNSSYITFAIMRKYIRLIPYGQKYIYLLSEIAVALSAYLIGLAGKQLRNGITGIYACAILAFSPYIYQQVSFEYRQYFMLLLSTVTVYYLFLLRKSVDKGNSFWFILLYSVCNMMIMDSHEYGKLVAGAFICIDLFLILVGNLKKRWFLSFVFPVIYGIYWIFNNEVGGLWQNYKWTINPTPKTVFETIQVLLSENKIFVCVFAVGIFYIIAKVHQAIKCKEDVINKWQGYIVAVVIVLAIFAASIIYSDFVNPANSLYVNRYFISVIVFIFIIFACGLDFLVELIICNTNQINKRIIVCACVCGIICANWQMYINTPDEHNQPYRQTAEYLRKDKAVYDEDTMIFIPDNGYVVTAWKYFFDGNRKKQNVNVFGKYSIDITDCIYEKIYVVSPAYEPTIEHQEYLDRNYILEKEDNNYPIKIYRKKKG